MLSTVLVAATFPTFLSGLTLSHLLTPNNTLKKRRHPIQKASNQSPSTQITGQSCNNDFSDTSLQARCPAQEGRGNPTLVRSSPPSWRSRRTSQCPDKYKMPIQWVRWNSNVNVSPPGHQTQRSPSAQAWTWPRNPCSLQRSWQNQRDTSRTPGRVGEWQKDFKTHLSPSAWVVGVIDAPLKVELAVGDGKTPLAHHRRHRHVHQLPVVETGTIQVQLPEQKL